MSPWNLFDDSFAIISSAGRVFVCISSYLALSYFLRKKHTFITQLFCRLRRLRIVAGKFWKNFAENDKCESTVDFTENCVRSGEVDV